MQPNRPTRYRFEACDGGPEEGTVVNADSLDAGEKLARDTGCTVIVHERTNIRAATKARPVALWDYDEEFLCELDPTTVALGCNA